jgi:preprotein translocase subunit SecG
MHVIDILHRHCVVQHHAAVAPLKILAANQRKHSLTMQRLNMANTSGKVLHNTIVVMVRDFLLLVLGLAGTTARRHNADYRQQKAQNQTFLHNVLQIW